MKLRNVLYLALLLVAALATGSWAASRRDESRFPHRRHAKLVADCEGCHANVFTKDSTLHFPSPQSCAECHNGTDEKRVDWTGPRVKPTNLRFDHAVHDRETREAKDRVNCRTCHGITGDSVFMAVSRARVEPCISCHGHKAPEHLASTAPCATCHVPVARAVALSDSQVADFPIPDTHRAPEFIRRHAPNGTQEIARCQTCHARESCARCHPNATSQRIVAQHAPDARIARLVSAKRPVYPTPESHRRDDWVIAHGDSARRQTGSCANCHAQPSCRTCHAQGTGDAGKVIRRLPAPDAGGAPGVKLVSLLSDVAQRGPGEPTGQVPERRVASAHATPGAPADVENDTLRIGARRDSSAHLVRVHRAGFALQHGASASSGRLDCQGCHTQKYCSNCHDGQGRRRFHAWNFVSRHASSAYGRERDCSSCHNQETFCRACHQGQGIATKGSRQVAYHDRQPLWLLQHAQAARQELSSCTTCHQQRDCLQCHSALGLRVNPHGPDFDAARMAKRNKQVCRTCHLGDPLRPAEP
jgi:hypothetical protein